MNIHSIGRHGMLQIYGNGKRTAIRREGYAAVDELSVSETAISFSRVLSSAMADSGQRTAEELQHIADITEQVQSGTYQVSGREVADCMLGLLGWSVYGE